MSQEVESIAEALRLFAFGGAPSTVKRSVIILIITLEEGDDMKEDREFIEAGDSRELASYFIVKQNGVPEKFGHDMWDVHAFGWSIENGELIYEIVDECNEVVVRGRTLIAPRVTNQLFKERLDKIKFIQIPGVFYVVGD
jgi:hypothetical protein